MLNEFNSIERPQGANAASAETIALALDGKKCGPESWHSRCPHHNGSKRNFYISQAGDRVLVHCFAGCSQEAVINELRARGLWSKRRAHVSALNDQEPRITRDYVESVLLFMWAYEGAAYRGEEIATTADHRKYERYAHVMARRDVSGLAQRWGLINERL